MHIDHREYDVQRLVLGVILCFGLATFIAWPFAYLSAIATCILLAARKPITLQMSIAVSAIVFLLANMLYWIFAWLSHYTILMAIMLFIASYMTLYRAATGGSKIITLIVLLAILIIPTSFNLDPDLAWVVTKWLPINALVGFLVASFCLSLMPLSSKIKQVDDSIRFATKEAHNRALLLCVAIMPVVMVFWLDNSVDVLLLVFLTLFIHRLVECPSVRYEVTIGYLLANIAGGALAVIAFELLVSAPSFLLLVLLSLVAVSILSLKMFTDEKHTVLAFTAINSYIALMGVTVLYNVADGEVAYFARLTQIVLITIYLLLFFGVYELVKGCLSKTTKAKSN